MTGKKKWQKDYENGLYECGTLQDIYQNGGSAGKLAIESARRLRAFHKDKEPKYEAMQDGCFLLIGWGDARKAYQKGIVLTLGSYVKQNVTIWANVTEEFYDKCVEPLYRRFTESELQSTFMW